MTHNFKDFFNQLEPVGAPVGLKSTIMERIRQEERHAAMRAVAILAPIVLLSLAGILWGLVSAFSSLSQTGFMQYLSLMFSDTGSIASLWYPFMLTILDSVPFFALTVLVGALFAFVSSTVIAAKNARSVFHFA